MAGILDTVAGKAGEALHAVGDGVHGMERAAGAVLQGAGAAAETVFHGAVDGAKAAGTGVVRAVADEAHGMQQAAHDVVDGARHGRVLGGAADAVGDMAKGGGKALGDVWQGASGAVEAGYKGTVGGVREAGKALGRAYDAGVDGAARAVGDVAGQKAGAVVRGVAEGLAAPVRDLAGAQFGMAQGVAEGAGSMVHGLGDLVVGGVRMGTDAEYRDKLVAKAGAAVTGLAHLAEQAAQHPGQALDAAGRAAHGLVHHLEQSEQAAARRGEGAEWLGHGVGRAGFEVASFLLPAAKAGEAANLVGKGVEAGDALADAGRVEAGARDAGEMAVEAGNAGHLAGEAGEVATRARVAEALGDKNLLQEINGAADEPIRGWSNCVQCAFNLDRRLGTGEATSATNLGRTTAPDMQAFGKALDVTFGAPFKPMDRAGIERTLLAQGEGARGVILGDPLNGRPLHMWNAVVHDNQVHYLDAQMRKWDAGGYFGQFPGTSLAVTGKVGDRAHDMEAFRAEEFARVQEFGRLKDAGQVGFGGTGVGVRSAGAAIDPAARQAAAAMSRIGEHGTATQADLDMVLDHLGRHVPAHMLQNLDAHGVKVIVTRNSVVEHYPEMRNVPLNLLSGRTGEHVPGQYRRDLKELVISTVPVDRAGDLNVRQLPNAPVTPSADALLHEVGHAVDRNLHGGAAEAPLSDDDPFTWARHLDRVALRPMDRYFRPDNEMHAEMFARFLIDPAGVQQATPHLYGYFRNLVEPGDAPITLDTVAAHMPPNAQWRPPPSGTP